MRPCYSVIPAVVAIAAVGCASNRADSAVVAPGGNDARVRRGDLQPRLLLTGELRAVEAENIVVPRTPTWRMPIRWMIADGAVVEEGARLMELDNTQFVGELEQKRLSEQRTLNDLARKEADVAVELADREFAVEQARIALEKAEIDATVPETLRSRREHQESLLALERARVGLVKARETLESYRESSRAELEVLRIELRKARREIDTAERAIAALTLRAPRGGIVIVEEHEQEGRKLQTGDDVWVGRTVMRMPDLSAMEVDARLSDVDDGRVAVGMQAVCTLDTYPEIQFPGRVVEIAPIAQEYGRRSLRRAFRVDVRLDQADPERMRPGMSVKVELLGTVVRDALIVPRRALDLTREPPRARLEGGDEVELGLGPCDDRQCVVESGLEEGERLEMEG